MGTSSSGAVALLAALGRIERREPPRHHLAELAHTLEVEELRIECGVQDQYAAAFGGLLRLDFSGADKVAVKRLAVPASRTAELQSHLMMFYTGMEQSADHVLAEQKNKVKQNVPVLLEMLKMVDVAEHILVGKGDLRQFGELLHESWMRKKTLSSQITNSMVDQAYETARGCGAIGGKLLGAGGRGFLLICAPPERHAAIRDKIGALKEVPFSLNHEGSRIIFRATE